MSDAIPEAGESPARDVAEKKPRRSRPATNAAGPDRSRARLVWYWLVRGLSGTIATVLLRWRATGHRHVPESGGVLLVANHLSYLDVFFLGIPLRRPLNYVARSTLFLPVLGPLIRSVGGFPIQREGIGVSGMKETLGRLRAGGIVTLFPEGTRSADGELAPLKSGIALLVRRAGVPVVPVGLAGTFEVWPRSRPWLAPHPIRVHFGRAIGPDELEGLDADAITALLRDRLLECRREAIRGLRADMAY